MLLTFWIFLPFIIVAVLTVGFIVAGLYFRRRQGKAPGVRGYTYLASLCFAAAAVSLGFFPVKYALDAVRYQNDSRQAATSLDFDVYEPSRMPHKLTARIIDDPQSNGNVFMVSHYGDIQIQEFDLARTARVFGAGQSECGPYDPDFGYVLKPCALLGRTGSGTAVYYQTYPPRSKPLGTDTAFAVLGGTGITVSGSFSNWKEVLDIYGSLKRVDPAKLQYMRSGGIL